MMIRTRILGALIAPILLLSAGAHAETWTQEDCRLLKRDMDRYAEAIMKSTPSWRDVDNYNMMRGAWEKNCAVRGK